MTAPRGLIQVDGAWRPRRMGFVEHLGLLQCLRGHFVPTNARFLSDGCLVCETPAGEHACLAMLYVLVVFRPPEPRKFFVADLAPGELRQFEEGDLDPVRILEFIGATFPLAVAPAARTA